jgi:hypothetical protein
MLKSILVAAVALSACSKEDSITAEKPPVSAGSAGMTSVGDSTSGFEVSGTRLKANVYIGEDGSKQFASWHDTQLNTDCTFKVAADGVVRCLPVAAGRYARFADSSCTQKVFQTNSSNCSAPAPVSYGIAEIADCSKEQGPHIFPVVPIADPTFYSIDGAGNCSELPSNNLLSQSFAYYVISGDEVPPSAFLAATRQTEP